MYHLIYGIVRFLSIFPLPVLYFFSDIIYAFTYYLAGYRKNVVLSNLRIAFPEKTEKERRRIAKDFYHRLIDTIIETLKFFSWDINAVNKRVDGSMQNIESLYASGRPVHVIGMHNFNWEFANWWVASRTVLPFYAIYLPVGNRHLERIMKKMRSRYGTKLIPATEFMNYYAGIRNTHHLLGSVADQSPATPDNAWWLDFFGRKTAFIRGAERGAISAGAGVVFIHFHRTRRGHYTMESRVVTQDASTFSPGQMTQQYAKFVEECVRRRPADYLWSHRRWKHEWKEEYENITLKK